MISERDDVPAAIARLLDYEDHEDLDVTIRRIDVPVDMRRITMFEGADRRLDVWLDGVHVATACRHDPGQTAAEAYELIMANIFLLPTDVAMNGLNGPLDPVVEVYILAADGPDLEGTFGPNSTILAALGFVEYNGADRFDQATPQ